MNFRRILTRKLTITATIVVIASLVIALVAVPAGAINQSPALPDIGDVLNSPGLIPKMINYQGYLTDDEGDPINDALPMNFVIYDRESGGNELWKETHPKVIVTDGLFNVMLGSINPILNSVVTGESYLGVTVGTDHEMTPRQPMVSVPYALRSIKAVDANTLDGLGLSDIDELYLNEIGPEEMNGAQMETTLLVTNMYGDALTGITKSEEEYISGVTGWAQGSSGETRGVWGISNSPQGIGVYGEAPNRGVEGYASSGSGVGVYGYSSGGTGVRGDSSSDEGVYGSSSSGIGVYGKQNTSGNYGELGTTDEGIYGEHNTSGNYGQLGTSDYGVHGYNSSGNFGRLGTDWDGVFGFGSQSGVHGYNSGSDNYGRLGTSDAGVYASGSPHGVYAEGGTWGLYTPDSLYVGGDVTVEGNVTISGQSSGFFPRPAYNSGWVSIAQGESKVLTHNLGGNADDYVVDMQFWSSTFAGINQSDYGGMEWAGNYYGAHWCELSNNTIKVIRHYNDLSADEVRVRIWVYK